ncbi:MAG: 3-dehydroquinate synthase [Thermoplasmata archaeon]|nr:3-dehydroquinate synthase [Thermoplasmata archaeon]
MTEEISLDLGDRKCSILVGRGLLGDIGKLVPGKNRRFAVITNPTVNPLYGKQVLDSLKKHGHAHVLYDVPDSEASKSLDAANQLYVRLSDAGFERDSCIIGLGGGVVGDLAGFVAATYMRGIDIIQVPTTLLAQVDSAIGGKTGLNLPGGKNLVGAFHQPVMVISDVSVLATLPDRDYVSGLAEVVKYGIAADPEVFALLESNVDRINRRDERLLEKTVARCSRIKAGIVQEDERDRGKRLLLNFGHTLGHALEVATGYETYRHGEAVAIGMLFAARVSEKKGLLKAKELKRIAELAETLGLPSQAEDRLEREKLISLMKGDKKSRGGKVHMVLPTGIGTTVISEIQDELLTAALEETGL